MSSAGTVAAFGGAPAAGVAPAKAEGKVKDNETDVDMGGLFGDDYWAAI